MLHHPNIHRCEHIKVNGTQCGPPSIRGKTFCYFHGRWQEQRVQLNLPGVKLRPSIDLPILEDADSVQVALMQVHRSAEALRHPKSRAILNSV